MSRLFTNQVQPRTPSDPPVRTGRSGRPSKLVNPTHINGQVNGDVAQRIATYTQEHSVATSEIIRIAIDLYFNTYPDGPPRTEGA